MKDFFYQYLPYYKNYKTKFIFALIGIILVALGTSSTAYIIKPLLDDVFIKKDINMLKIIPFLIIIIYFAKGFGRYIQVYYISYIGQDIIRIVRDKLVTHILHLDISFFSQKHSGELISNITNDINRIQLAVSNQIAQFLRETLTIIALIGVVIYQSPTLAFYGLVVLPLAILPLSILAKKMKKLSFKSQEKNSDITSNLSETFNNIEIIKAHCNEKIQIEDFKKHNKKFFQVNMKSVKTNELTSPLMETIGAIAIAIVIIVGGTQVINDQMSVGSFFSFMTALFMLYTPIKKLSQVYNSIQDAIAANERIEKLFKTRSKILSGSKNFPKNITNIDIQNVVLKYNDKIALNNINLKASLGDTIALVGNSGAGKSSLMNLLIRFYDINSGDIKIDDISINSINIKELRKNISIVTQRIYIFNDTIASNIAYGQEIIEEKIITTLKQTHAYDFVSKMPNGIYTKLNEFGSNLSGGQRQKIAIARALYKDPKILILDEATSSLDNQSQSIISEVLDEISKDKITFIIAHRLSTIKDATKIALFQKGQIISIGKEAELLKSCKEYQKLYNLANI